MSGVSRLWAITALALMLSACHSLNAPSNSVVGAQPASPSTNATFSYYDQPITLSV